MRKWIFFTFMAFVFAMIHACSLQNNIIKPSCQVFQFDMADKWWTPVGSNASGKLYFSSGGAVTQESTTDSVTYNLQNCSSLVMHDYTSGETKDWVIQSLVPTKMVVMQNNATTVTYTSNN